MPGRPTAEHGKRIWQLFRKRIKTGKIVHPHSPVVVTTTRDDADDMLHRWFEGVMDHQRRMPPGERSVRIATNFVVIPDEELTDPIHVMTGPRSMLCGVESGHAVSLIDVGRMTCKDCCAILVKIDDERKAMGVPIIRTQEFDDGLEFFASLDVGVELPESVLDVLHTWEFEPVIQSGYRTPEEQPLCIENGVCAVCGGRIEETNEALSCDTCGAREQL